MDAPFMNRVRQLQLLESAAVPYPDYWNRYAEPVAEPHDHDKCRALYYLAEHGLLEIHQGSDLGHANVVRASAKGLDFLADDGGLSAVLNVVTVRLADDQFKELLLERIDSDKSLTVDQQSLAKKAVKALTAEGLKRLGQLVVDKAIETAPSMGHWILQAVTAPGVN